MKKFAIPVLVAAAVVLSAPVIAADKHDAHGSHAPAPAAEVALTDGVVKKIDKATGKVTLAHGPLNGMPGMTMAFGVKEAAWLDQMKVGQKIRFAANSVDGALVVVKFEPVK